MVRIVTEDETSGLLVAEAQNALPGDTRAFNELVRRHRGHVVANCRHLSGSEEQAEDLAQEVFVIVYRRLESFEGRSRFRTWLQRVKINHCLSWLRRRRSEPHLDVDDPKVQTIEALAVPAAAAEKLEALSERERIHAILESLPDNLRTALVLCDVDELPYDEVARTLGIGLSAAKMRVKRGREMFREAWNRAERRDTAHVDRPRLRKV
jgi:RNA polymerase sigma-70 factor (ECF subfamily)